MSTLTHWLGHVALGFQDRAERRPLPGLAVFHANGEQIETDAIRNISATGLYLSTRAKWPRNALVAIRLQRTALPGEPDSRSVALQARVVRREKDGVALSFVLPRGLELNLWESPLRTSREDAAPEDVLREFQLARAIQFLCRICPGAEARLQGLLRRELSSYRVASAVDIALRAESLLELRSATTRLRIEQHALLRILQEGSWVRDEWRLGLWAGLLAGCCSNEGGDEIDNRLVHAISQLAAVHARLLVTACRRTTKVFLRDGALSALPLILPASEMSALAGTHDLHRIECDLDHLAQLGLFVRRESSPFFVPLDDASMTPTVFGLEVYARCCGHRGSLSNFYSVAYTELAIIGAMN